MKVAFFTYYPLEYGGGVAKYFVEVTTGLKKRYKELDIEIITFNENTFNKILFIYSLYFLGKQDKAKKEKNKRIKGKLFGIKYNRVGIFQLIKRLQQNDLIYTSNNLLEVLLLKFLIGYRKLPPVIYGFHIPSHYAQTGSLQSKFHNILYASFIYKIALGGAYKLHVLNSFDEKRYSKYFERKKVVKIYNPFDFKNFVQKEKKFSYKYYRNNKKFNILWVGRLTEQKGVDDLVELVNLINSSKYKNRIVWNVVGDGELKSDIESISIKWANVNYYGYVTNDFLPSIYKNNHLFITTSKWESFPYTLLEAQSFGLPVVAYDIHGIRDIVDNKKNGYLVETTNQFKNKIIQIVNGKVFDKSLIRGYIIKKFDIEDIYNRLHSLFVI